MNPQETMPVLIGGGSYRRAAKEILVQRRSWEMIRLFSDQMANPVFAMYEAPTDVTLTHPLPAGVRVVTLPSETMTQRTRRTFLNNRLPSDLEELLRSRCVVYTRFPDWGCVRLFRRALSWNCPIIASLHGNWAETYRSVSGRALVRGAGFCMATYVDAIYRQVARRSDILFCTGEQLDRLYGRFSGKSIQIANYLHTAKDIVAPRDSTLEEPIRLLFVGQLEERKGIVYLLEAMERLVHHGMRTTLNLVGRGPLRNHLMEHAASLGLSDAIEFVDYIQYGPELLEKYRRADLLVLPSVSGEGLPKVLMEAMSQGLPVIATDVGSTRTMLGNGDQGLIVPPCQPQLLAKAIFQLATDDTLRHSFIAQGIAAARRATRDVQEARIRQAFSESLPWIVGVPSYLCPESTIPPSSEIIE